MIGTDFTVEIKTTVNVSRQRINDLLTTAFEGGSAYWAMVIDRVIPDLTGALPDDLTRHGKPYQADYPLGGGSVTIEDSTGEDAFKPVVLDMDRIKRGLEIMAKDYPRHFRDFIEDNEDAETGDVFLQCCIHGEIVFG